MNGLNLSQWALRHRALVIYFMLAVAAAGALSYVRFGRSEDPSFTLKLMVIQARWPGATIDDTIKQVTERVERKAQETPNLDYVSSYTKPGESTVFVARKGSTLPRDVPDAWYQVRSNLTHRGKAGGFHDFELLEKALVGLHDAMRHLLAKQLPLSDADRAAFASGDRLLRTTYSAARGG